MSITFQLALREEDIQGWEIICWDESHSHTKLYNTWESAKEGYETLAREGLCEVGECIISIVWPEELEDHAINVANANGREILKNLGLEPDESGEVEAEDLIGRVLLAQALVKDTAKKSFVAKTASGATLIDPGRAKGYMSGILERMMRLAEHAKKNSRTITWG